MPVDTGDTAWVLIAAALVMFMTPGLAFFYGGLVRSKNVLGTVMQSLIALGIGTLAWVLVGYTLAFGPDIGGVIGGLSFAGLRGVGAAPSAFAPTVPASAFMIFQMMFAIITPALITGAFAERMKFSGYCVFLALWSVVVYAPVAHWVWGGGFLGANGIGALDFAGGTVVHISAGVAALATILYVGKRRGYGKEAMMPHNVPMVVLGGAILWFGWFGFNAGSALAANGVAANAFVTTHIAAATAMLAWLIPERIKHGHFTTVGAVTGAVAGLVAITPAAGYVEPWAAVMIGLVAGSVCYLIVNLKTRIGYDDSLDVVGVHMVGGIIGALLTGVFATLAVNPAGGSGSLAQLGKQALAVVITLVFSFVVTMLLLRVVDRLVGLRLSEEDEYTGLDLSQHSEVAYTWQERGGVSSSETSAPTVMLPESSEAVPAAKAGATVGGSATGSEGGHS